ncbi:protein argonaute 5 [Pyrus ussuriensis x Pyrus communis]|uniref:Protein argonaute 5 n=1 Tax=Pyrus ussuriensis x Pyrus communis TaxID=2448454 RepID=A0A5N5GLS1_9ROSA|nr:protein argonaute 5 [Pyrus ussuriensis x Pyrus communis]
MKSIYTAGPLPFASKEFLVKLAEKDGREDSSAAAAGSKRRDREFKLTLKLSSKPDLYQLQQFLQSQQHESPQEETQVLDVALRAAPPEKYSSFATELGQKGGDLGEGQEYWRGFSQSQFGLSLNIDVSARAIYEPIMVTEFVKKLLSDRQLSRPLPDRDCLKGIRHFHFNLWHAEKKPLKGVEVPLSYEEHTGYEITAVSVEPRSKLKFTHERYNIGLRDVAMPLSTIGSGKRYSRLNERQATALLRMVKHNGHNKDEEDMTLVNARVLWPPLLKYHHTGREKSENALMGQWNMINKLKCLTVFEWISGHMLIFPYWTKVLTSDSVRICEDLLSLCNSKGVHFHPQPLLPHQSAHPGKIERVLGDIHKMSSKQLEEVGQKGRHLQLLIIILPDVTGSYEKTIKRFWKSELGVVSQCCQPIAASRLNKQYLENLSLEYLSLEINVKFGGRNTVAIRRRIPLVSDIPTIIFAVDVIHPQPGKDSSLSIAADPNNGLVGGGMIRDGVSEDQFCQVLLHEMDAIRKFCHTRKFNFYLNSHASIQVTNMPTHHHVMYDENKFSPDCLQVGTNNICYNRRKCTRAYLPYSVHFMQQNLTKLVFTNSVSVKQTLKQMLAKCCVILLTVS